MQQIKSVKIRFDKWHHTTEKAHLLTYKGEQIWVPKKLAWDFMVVGNDMHAWAVIPAWLFEKITGMPANEMLEEYGTNGMKEYFGAIIHTIVEKHVPNSIAPVETNFITELKK